MGFDRKGLSDLLSGRWHDLRHIGAHARQALAEVEEQRDDAVVYLSVIKLVLEVVGQQRGQTQCAQAIAELLVRELAIETCAVILQEGRAGTPALGGFATQAQRLGGPTDQLGEAGWVALVELVGARHEPMCFCRNPDGGFTAVAPSELDGEGFCVLPFNVGGEAGGALVLHSLVAPAQVFARGRALALVAEIVGQAFTVAHARDAAMRLSTDLEDELGVTRRALATQQESLRSHEESIQELTQALIRSNRVKREFLGTVSHELRTPLNAILGYSSLVREGAAGLLSDEQTSLLDRVLGNTRNLNALIDDMLFFVQVESDRLLIRPERVVIADAVADILEALPGRPPEDKVTLVLEIDPAAATLHVDGGLVRRMIFHLLSNAFKFTKQGRINLVVRPADERGRAVIEVADTGVGIPAERIDELFEAFTQADASTTRRYNGLGMGLTLVQRCSKLLGGEVTVESEVGKGSTFRVCLPGVLRDDSQGDTPQRSPDQLIQ